MRPADVLAPVLLFAAASTAFPWPSRLRAPIEAAKREIEPFIIPRAPQASKTTFDLSFSGTQGNTATTEQTTAQKTDPPTTATGSDASNTGSAQSSDQKSDGTTGKSTGKQTGNTSNGGSTGSGSSDKPTQTSSKIYDPRLPAGGVSMITPNAMTTHYYKVNDWVTFAWNYTSLSATPSAVDVLVSCSQNSATYTIALNQSIPTGAGGQQTVLWDTAPLATASVPLLTSTYTLIIYDAQSSVSATPQAGYLGTYDQFTFGMYLPQLYVPYSEWHCTTCSGAGGLERQTLGFIVGTAVITVLSFSWFAGVAGFL